jgi:hypothetical protein
MGGAQRRLSLGRAEVRRRLRTRLAELDEPLRILAEEIRGEEEAVIDWVAALPNGRVVVGLLRLEEGDACFLTEGLVQRAWVAARLRDWEKLAPGLDIRSELRPVLLLVAPGFSRKLRLAAPEADAQTLKLISYRWEEIGTEHEPRLQAVNLPERPALSPPSGPQADRSAFRTGLSDEDLELTPEERASLA